MTIDAAVAQTGADSLERSWDIAQQQSDQAPWQAFAEFIAAIVLGRSGDSPIGHSLATGIQAAPGIFNQVQYT